MKTFKVLLPAHIYKDAKKAATAKGISLGQLCQDLSPVPVEVYVKAPTATLKLVSPPFDKTTGLEA